MDCGLLLWLGGVKLAEGLNVLSRMEFHKYPGEPSPVGGEGAGILYLKDGVFRLAKVGYSSKPTEALAEKIGDLTIHTPVLLGHVRRASQNFKKSIPYPWGAQPYSCSCLRFKVFSIHNGFIQNYAELRLKEHHYESYQPKVLDEPPHFIDSEVIPHKCAELVEKYGVKEGFERLFEIVKGNSTWIVLLIRDCFYLGIFHKGKTRGLHVYEGRNSLIAVTRSEALIPPENLKKIVEIEWRKESELFLTYRFKIKDGNISSLASMDVNNS